MPRRLPTRLVVATAIGIAMMIVAAVAVATMPAWRTGAHTVVQRGPDGENLSDVDCTEAIDIHVRMIVRDGAAWTWCLGGAFPHGALTRIDPRAGEATVRWPLPAELPFGDATVGVFPGPDDTLGIVFRVGDVNGRLAIAIAGSDGWVHAPTALPGRASSRLLGGAWLDGALEVALLPTGDGAEEDIVKGVPVFVRAEAGSLHERRPFEDKAEFCRNVFPCIGGAHAAQHREGAWQIAVESDRDVWWIDESGAARPSGWGTEVATMPREFVDFADVGLTYRPVLDRRPLLRDGSLGDAPQPQSDAWETDAAWADFEVVDGRLRRRASFVANAGVLHRGQQVGNRFLATNSTYEIDPPILAVTEGFADGTERTTPVAHDPGYECGGELSIGAFIAQPDSGFALVSDTGCYVMLGPLNIRLDPLPLSEHLLRRGSLGRWNERSHAVELAWVLVGLPVCIGLAIVAAVVRRRRTPTPIANAAAIGAWIYVVTGAVCLAMVVPLLT